MDFTESIDTPRASLFRQLKQNGQFFFLASTGLNVLSAVLIGMLGFSAP